ncbi:MAG: LOG family protein [Chloroflexi bacterium]|nr:MAG: LOG family protein [Chloroflexota bacterium]
MRESLTSQQPRRGRKQQNDRPVIVVFGGSAPGAGDPAYQEALYLGQALARAGFAVASGGYIGVMEAVSRGASEAGGHVIGITCQAIEAWRPGIVPNRWVAEEVRFATLQERMRYMLALADGIVACRGSIGTLSEVAMAWAMLQVGEIASKPLVLLGAGWSEFLRAFQAVSYVRPEDLVLLHLSPTVEEAVAFLTELLKG